MSERRYWFWVLPPPNNRHLTPSVRDAVVAKVAAEHDVCAKDILSPSRIHRIAHARQTAMWRLRLKGYSSCEIGRAFDRDHATVLWAFDQILKRAAAERAREAA